MWIPNITCENKTCMKPTVSGSAHLGQAGFGHHLVCEACVRTHSIQINTPQTKQFGFGLCEAG